MTVTANSSTAIGASLAVLASILNAVGYTLQKEGHNKLNQHNANSPHPRKIISERIWIIGFSIFIIGGLTNAMALYYAPQSLVLPLSAFTLVVNTVLATRFLGEPFQKQNYLGIVLVIVGSTMSVVFGPRTGGESINIEFLMKQWHRMGFMLFFVCLSGVAVIDFVGIKYYERLNVLDPSVSSKEIKHGKSFLLMSYGFMVGYFGSNAFLFLKAFTEFLGASFKSLEDATAALVSWYSYFILLSVLMSNYLLFWWQQRGLSYFPSVFVIPINQVNLIVVGTILGGVYFREFEGLPPVDFVMFIVSILITSVGVIALAVGHTLLKDIQLELPLHSSEEAYKDIDKQHSVNNGHGLQRCNSLSRSRSRSRSESRSSSSDYLATAASKISVEIPIEADECEMR